MPKFKFAKLVRDKIIEKQIASGAAPVSRQLSPDKHKQALIHKIIEEATEIIHASADEIAGEIADVQQALDDLRELYDLTPEMIREVQHRKAGENGAFAKGYFIETVELADDDPWVEYYRKYADRYPEVK